MLSGYEYAKDEYVVINPDELESLRTPKDYAIDVSKFASANQMDELYLSGKSHFLLPDGPVGQKPYQLIQRVMSDRNVCAIGQVVISKKEELVLVRPHDKLLVMEVLNFKSEVKDAASFEDELVASA